MDRDVDSILDTIDTKTFLQDQALTMGMDLENGGWLPNSLEDDEQDALRKEGF
ncbi:hypothetical protein KHP62_10720 [Rhodobacteraceae bacterium NNCM2]|nr:hypothetical protein [Coraliihabitans acroporae]